MRPADQMLDIPPPIVGVAIGWRTWLVMIASTLLGLFAIGWPLLIPAVGVARSTPTTPPSSSPPCCPSSSCS